MAAYNRRPLTSPTVIFFISAATGFKLVTTEFEDHCINLLVILALQLKFNIITYVQDAMDFMSVFRSLHPFAQ